MQWDVAQYERFGGERSRPFGDLVAAVHHPAPREVVDLGCGSGELLAGLAARWPDASLLGLDDSAAMLAKAPPATDRFRVQQADLASWSPGPRTDVVVSNAALQWVDEHRTLIAAWADALAPGAWLAFQMPGNFTAPSHALMRGLSESPAWSDRLAGLLRPADTVSDPSYYAGLLLDHGVAADAWETTYLHLLTGPDPVLNWVRGSGLRPVLDALPAEDAARFEREYAARLDEAYPPGPHGTFFPFRRVFCVGVKQ